MIKTKVIISIKNELYNGIFLMKKQFEVGFHVSFFNYDFLPSSFG